MTERAAAVTVVLGILNVTPDSFSDGGEHFALDAALAHARALHAAGADIVDVGGESTRPGAERVDAAEEQRRVIPVIAALTAEGIATSVDTMSAVTALAAVAAGASVINDVSGGLADPAMPDAMASVGVDVIAMHWRGHAPQMDALTDYRGAVVDVVCEELAARRDALVRAGVAAGRIILDPGLGFAKTADQSWQVLHGIEQVASLGHRVLVGASRKRFVKAVVGDDRSALDAATAATSVLAAERGVWGVRVHDVVSTRVALATAAAFARGSVS